MKIVRCYGENLYKERIIIIYNGFMKIYTYEEIKKLQRVKDMKKLLNIPEEDLKEIYFECKKLIKEMERYHCK